MFHHQVQGSKGQLVLCDRQCFTTKKGKGRCDVGEACLVCVALVVRPKTSGAPNIFVNPNTDFPSLSLSPLPFDSSPLSPPQFAFNDAGRYVSTAHPLTTPSTREDRNAKRPTCFYHNRRWITSLSSHASTRVKEAKHLDLSSTSDFLSVHGDPFVQSVGRVQPLARSVAVVDDDARKLSCTVPY